jgi:hypothetical protein
MRKTTIAAVVVAVMLAIPATLYASHQFNDVPNSHTFHEAISWMADNGITQGCNPPANTNYCPENSVTRGQMAGFMKRFYDNLVAGGGTGLGFAFRLPSDAPDGGSGVVSGLSMNLRIPDAGVLLVAGSVETTNEVTADVFGCAINFGTPPSTAEPDSIRTIDLTFSIAETCSTTTAVVVSPGTQLVRIVTGEALASTQARQGSLTAVLYTVDGVFPLSGPTDAVEFPSFDDTPRRAG